MIVTFGDVFQGHRGLFVQARRAQLPTRRDTRHERTASIWGRTLRRPALAPKASPSRDSSCVPLGMIRAR